MSLITLPEEIFIIIIRKLDLKSLFNLYNTCEHARSVLRLHNLIKDWHMTMSSMATVQYLKSNFFRDVASHLLELNLCGVPDLCKTALLPALRHLKNLKSLDVSYTDIDLMDFCDMYKACPSIKNISINFNKNEFNENSQLIDTYQDIFQNMENVHLVGTCALLIYSNIVLLLLRKSALNILKLTVVVQRDTIWPVISGEEKTSSLKFNEFYVYFMNLDTTYGYYYTFSIFQGINTDNYEKIIIVNGAFLDEIAVYATPVFKNFFSETFDINAHNIKEFDGYVTGNVSIMMFNKESVKFDAAFFSKLYKRVNDYFPYVFDADNQSPGPAKFCWYFSRPVVSAENKNNSNTVEFKKRRIGSSNFTLDYDTVFKVKHKVKLSLSFYVNYVKPVTLSPNSEFLSKLTFLSLSGTVRYSVEFFNVLFRCCNSLITLDVTAPSISPCFPSISRSIPLSQTLRNLRLIDRNIDFNTFFLSLSQCKTLENIHIFDQSSESITLADPSTLFENCEHLYNICIKAFMTDNVKTKMLRLFNKAKKARARPHINVSICQILLPNDRNGSNYEPSLEVFNVFPIKPGPLFV